VCGPKGAGKSTLARLAVNTLLQHVHQVAFLDVDPGQSELTPPGLVSLSHLTAPLLGPPALRLGCSDAPEPVEQRFIGDVSPSGDPAAYITAVDSLLSAWRNAPHPVPVLVVNTMGWIRGLGLELLCSLLRGCQPTHVLSLAADHQQDRGVPPGIFWTMPGEDQPPCEVLQLAAAAPGVSAQPAVATPGPPLDPGMVDEDPIDGTAQDAPAQPALGQARQRTGADLRGLLWAAWCHRASTRGGADLADTIWADAWAPRTGGGAPAATMVAEALTRAAPYCVKAAAFRLVALLTHLEAGEAYHALNGAVVGLGVHDAHGAAPRCVGLALVRSVDPGAGMLYLLTPVPVALASTADTLLLGKLELPLALLLSPPHSCPYVALGALSGAEATGASSMRSRNNLLRRGTAAPT
jgi:polynucleotide 5'-hydroxyl-kinase GRC3/NOL9